MNECVYQYDMIIGLEQPRTTYISQLGIQHKNEVAFPHPFSFLRDIRFQSSFEIKKC